MSARLAPRALSRLGARLALQSAVGQLLSPAWIPGLVVYLYWWRGYRVEGHRELRAEFKRIRAETRGPLLICPNHLTLVDSFLVAWALGSAFWYLRHFSALAWNVPERRNFAGTIWSRAGVYVLKCLPITRGGNRREVAGVLKRVQHLLARGQVVLLFPEGGRTRTERVDPETAAYGVGRVVGALPGCRVLCVYMRGEGQDGYSDMPARGERFRVGLSCLEPKSDLRGIRRSIDLSRQITARLADLERSHFDDRE